MWPSVKRSEHSPCGPELVDASLILPMLSQLARPENDETKEEMATSSHLRLLQQLLCSHQTSRELRLWSNSLQQTFLSRLAHVRLKHEVSEPADALALLVSEAIGPTDSGGIFFGSFV